KYSPLNCSVDSDIIIKIRVDKNGGKCSGAFLGELDMRRDMESENLSAELCRESCGKGGVEKIFSLLEYSYHWEEHRAISQGRKFFSREELSFLSDRANSVEKYFYFFAPSQLWSWLAELDMRRHGVTKLVSRILP
ncbi:hypothetical protein CEXT_464281, partial [Caerostris extrusa]